MSNSTRINQALVILILASIMGLAGGWVFTRILANRDNLVLADASERLENASLRIVYLSANDDPTINNMAQSGNIAVLQDADLVKKLDSRLPLDVLLFDAGFKSQLDQQWIQRRYNQGMAVSGINVDIKELAELVGDRAVLSGPWQKATSPKDKSFFSLLQLVVSGDDPEEVRRYLNEQQSLANEDGSYQVMEGVKSPLSISRTQAQVPLSDTDTLTTIIQAILTSVTDPTP